MASKPPKRERHPLDKIPTRKLAAGVRKQLLRQIEQREDEMKADKPKKT
jgi:hypothetical protein